MSFIIEAPTYDLTKTMTCGQVFRYKALGTDDFEAYSKDLRCRVRMFKDILSVDCDARDNDYWVRYFNTAQSHAELKGLMSVNPVLREAYEFSKGTAVLRQDPFECLVNFIISQQKRIPQIQSCIELLCELCGEMREGDYRAFPEASQISRSVIPQLRLGYRGPYLYDAAQQVATGDLVLEDYNVKHVSYEVAMQRLQRIHGVGVKVANCVALFSLDFTNAFPIDTHIQKVLDLPDMKDFDPKELGDYAGLVQQYLYNYALYNGY